jgi:hypothetical protein
VFAAAVIVVVVGAASAYGTVRVFFGDANPHVGRTFFDSEGKKGSFGIRILLSRPKAPASSEEVRRWRIVPEATTGQYVQVSGRGRVVRIGGHAVEWHARLEGSVSRPGEARQRVVITMKGRPDGVFVLTPLQPGVLKRDSGTLTYSHATG